jgi:hypothetical protein
MRPSLVVQEGGREIQHLESKQLSLLYIEALSLQRLLLLLRYADSEEVQRQTRSLLSIAEDS